MKHTWMTMTAIVAMLGSLSPAAMADTSTGGPLYSDVTSASYGGKQIIALTSDGYLQGFSDGAFRPSAVMTRGEFASDLWREWDLASHQKPVANPHAPITPAFVASLLSQALSTAKHMPLPHGQTALQYAMSMGLFRGVKETQPIVKTRASAAIMLYNALLWKQGKLLPTGEMPVVTGSASRVSPNSLVSLHVQLRSAKGELMKVPSSATVSFSVTQSAGALLLPSTQQLMISSPGVYQVTATVDGVASRPWTVTAGDPPAAVHVQASRTVMPANGKATALITATVVDEFGHTVTGFSGTATLIPLLHGTYVDPKTGAPITTANFVHGVAHFAVEAGSTGGVSDTVTMDELATTSGKPITSSIDYGWVTMDYTWGSDQPAGVQVSAARGSLSANGQQVDAMTAKVVNTYGQTIADFNGSAQLTPLVHGTYINPSTHSTISSVTFVHGIAHFAVVAGMTGGVSDTVSLFNLSNQTGTPTSSSINYGSTTITYNWSNTQPVGVDLTPSASTLLANGEQTDAITATVVNALGQPVTNFSGVAELTPLLHGTYINPATGGWIDSVTFTHGVAHFDVQAGTTGGVTDTVSMADLTATGGQVLTSAMNYGTATIDYAWTSAQPVAVSLTPSTSTLVANGAQTATITATVIDAFGQPATGFDGTAMLAPLQHGTYVDPTTGAAISSVTFVNGVATFAVEAGTTGGVSDTVSLLDLTSGTGQAVTAVNNGSATIDYTWPANQPAGVQLTAASGTLPANGEQTDLITATAVNAQGQVVSDFNGTAVLKPLQHGTYVNPTTGGTISSVTFVNGVAHFAVQAGLTGGVSDTVSLSDLAGANGVVASSGVSYSSLTLNYTWTSAQPVAVTLTPSTSTLVANGVQTATITATVMDAFGQPAAGFDGTAALAPLQYGSYVDPTTGAAISSVTFVNGVATFAVESGTTGGVSDTVSLQDLTSNTGEAVSGVSSANATIDYSWPSANAIALSASSSFVSDTAATQDEVKASIPSVAGGAYAAGVPIAATFTLSGPGSFAQGGTPQKTLTEYIIPGTPTIVPVWSIAGDAGTITVTATASGITSAQTSILSGATGQADSLSVQQASETINAVGNAQESTLTEGTPFTLYTVGLMDASGYPVVPETADPLTISDNTDQVGGNLEYFAVSGGQPTGPAESAADLDASISGTTGQVQFAVVNTQEGTANPTITIADSLGLSTTVPYTFSAGTPEYAMFPLDTVGDLSAATEDMESGQTATYAVQVEDVNGNPVASAGETVDLYFAAKSNTQKVEIDGSSTWSATTPFTATTNPEGQAVFTVTVPQGVGGAVTLDAAVPGASAVSSETLAIESSTQYTTTLTLGAGLGAPAITWPTGNMTVGQTLLAYLNASANDMLGDLYATPVNSAGEYTKTNDMLEITTSNPSVLGLTSGTDWTELNGSPLMLVGSATNALPTITALSAGTATLTITDISNPSAPRISEVITVQ
ncbi:MAG: S-layer homology domain-containing protein [Firmicutes bacterium]|nr:S-layer homology domain-containing protein [Bacillota bacterium]